jgi:hypothetical protein
LSILSVVLAAVYYSEMMGYIVQGNLNIRIHRDITDDMWLGVRQGVLADCSPLTIHIVPD